MSRRLVGLALVVAAALPTALTAQNRSAEAGSARLIAFLNEPREPELGEIFRLDVRVRVAPGVVAFLSDTLAEAANSVSAGPGTWTVIPGPADSLDVNASYPVMGFLPGGVELPFVELWTRPAEGGETPGVRPAREHREPFDTAAFEHALLYLGGVFVMPPSEMVGDDAELIPRPPADVVGGERSPWLLATVALVASAGALVAWLMLTGRMAGRGAGALPILSPRAEALRELDRIRELGWHTNGRVAEFYDATTGVLRHYAERREPGCDPALTSTELLARLRQRWGSGAVDPLGPTVCTAECVKFGGRRPGADSAEADWGTIRDWIARAAEDA